MMSDDELPPVIDRAMAWDPFESLARTAASAKAVTPKGKPAVPSPVAQIRIDYRGGFIDTWDGGDLTAGVGKQRKRFSQTKFQDSAAMKSAAETWIIKCSPPTGTDYLSGTGSDETTAAGTVGGAATILMQRSAAATMPMQRPAARAVRGGKGITKRKSFETDTSGQGNAKRKSPLTTVQKNDMHESARELVEEAQVSCPIEPDTKKFKWREFSNARHATLRKAHAGHNMLVYSKAVAIEWASVKESAGSE